MIVFCLYTSLNGNENTKAVCPLFDFCSYRHRCSLLAAPENVSTDTILDLAARNETLEY